ncbi:cell wall-binding repeat-containing protein [Clostridium sp. JNZ X4-2]
MKKVISRIITFLFVIGIAISGFGSSAYAADSTSASSTGTDVSITKDRLAGNDRIETSLEISKNGWKDGANTVVIAQGYGYADALCAAPLAKKNNAPIILSRQDSLSDNTISEIKRLKAKKAFVIGGTASLSDNVESQLKSLGISDTERLGGADRYETSVKIAKELGNTDSVVVTSGAGYADSLSIAPIAAAKGMPILLTRSSSLPDLVDNYIKEMNVSKTYVVGGTAVIEDGLKNSLPNAQRLGGTTRFDTNLIILQNFKSDLKFDNVYIAEGNGPNGDEFADALSGSVLAAQKSAPLVLIYKTIATDTANFIKSNMSDKTVLTALGGTLVVPDTILSGIEDLYNGKTPGEGIGDPTTPSNPSTGGGGSGGGTSNPDSNHVSLVIDGYKGNIVSESSLSFTKGDTVFDVLKRTLDSKGIHFTNTGSGGTTYISSINHEAEKDRPQGGGKSNYSGWKYSVDGTFPSFSCGASQEILQGGEKIHWIYVLDVWDETCFRDVDSVKLNKNSLNLNVNGSETLGATVSPSNATDKDVVWSSSNESVATVDANGKVKAVGSGTAAITAESVDNGKFNGYPNYDTSKNKDICTVTVSGSGGGGSGTNISVTSVTLDKTSTTIQKGSTDKLTAAITPSNATDKGLTWSSSDESVATVDQNGLVTGVGAGTATITVITADGNKTASCTVTVNDGTLQNNIVEIHKEGLDLTISKTAVGTVNIKSKAPNVSDDITITLYDEDGNLAYINQAAGTMDCTTVLDSAKRYHGFIKASSTDKIEISEFGLNEDTVPVTGVTLDKTSTTVEAGGIDQLTAAVAPTDATNKGLTWSSSDESVATVDQNGVVTGVSAGTATITVTTADGNKTAACTVTVNAQSSEGTVLVNIDGTNNGGLGLNITQTAIGVVNINSSSKNASDYIAITLYDENGNLAYINQGSGSMNFNTILVSGKYHGFIKSSVTNKITIDEFTVQ